MLNRKIVTFAFEKYEKVGLIKIFQIQFDCHFLLFCLALNGYNYFENLKQAYR